MSFCPDSIFYSDFYSPFYQWNRCRRPQLATWDIYAHRQDIITPFMPLPCIAIYEAAMQKERWVFVQNRFFTVIFFNNFLIKLLSPSPTCNMGYLHPQTEFQDASHATRSHHHVQSSNAKRTVSFCSESIFYSDFYSPFFQLNCCRRPQLATWDIYTHRQNLNTPLTPLPLIALLNIYPIF